MTEMELQIFARQNMHELVLEIILAQTFASQPEEEGEAFAKGILKLSKSAQLPSEADPDHADQALDMLHLSGQLLERLLNKSLQRASAIKA